MKAVHEAIRMFARPEPLVLAQAVVHLTMTDAIRRFQGTVDIALLGDSITQNWQWNESWKRAFGGMKALNLGLGGDATPHLLWRLEQGMMDGLNVRQAVLLIGVNDCWTQPPASRVIEGVAACLVRLRKALPETRLLLYGIFPLRSPVAHLIPLVTRINKGIAPVAKRQHVEFRDIGDKFRIENGQVPHRLMPDGCHLSEEAYGIWEKDLFDWMKLPIAFPHLGKKQTI